jgi:hypothetical protein
MLLTLSLGAIRLGTPAFTASQSFNRRRASSGSSENRTPARPNASAHAMYPVVSSCVAGSERSSLSCTRRSRSSLVPACIANPCSLKSKIIPPVTPSKLAKAGACTICRKHFRRSPANSKQSSIPQSLFARIA